MAGITMQDQLIIFINPKKEAKVIDVEIMRFFHTLWLGYKAISKNTAREPNHVKKLIEEIAEFMEWSLEDH